MAQPLGFEAVHTSLIFFLKFRARRKLENSCLLEILGLCEQNKFYIRKYRMTVICENNLFGVYIY